MKTSQTITCNDCGEPVRESDNHPCDTNRRAKYGLAPNKAQHSPLPEREPSASREDLIRHIDFLTRKRAQETRISDHYKAHADKLAEALRDCETTPGALAERSHEYALRRLATITETAKAALAAYEAAQ